MNPELIEDIEINKINIKTFKYMFFDASYKCCLCKKKVYTDESYSNRGDRLICSECYYSKFKNTTDARKWIDRKGDD